jgi:hypothetical protein
MARFYGEIGFGGSVEVAPGVWDDVITTKNYRGDIVRNNIRSVSGEGVNNDPALSDTISIVANEYAFTHLSNVRYIKFRGERWTVDSIEVKRPRLILSLGGVYNGPEDGTPNAA